MVNKDYQILTIAYLLLYTGHASTPYKSTGKHNLKKITFFVVIHAVYERLHIV